jgi:hypothetical protein
MLMQIIQQHLTDSDAEQMEVLLDKGNQANISPIEKANGQPRKECRR